MPAATIVVCAIMAVDLYGQLKTLCPQDCASIARPDDRVKLLLEHGADVNIKGGIYGTAVQAACRWSDLEQVRLLLDYGADVHIKGGYYGSAWHAAVARPTYINGRRSWSTKSILQLLLDRGIDINDTAGRGHTTALQAVLEEHDVLGFVLESVMQLLLRHGANVKIGGGEYGSALQSACAHRYSDGTEFLLDHFVDIDVNISGEMFGSALQAAAFSGQTDSVRRLLEKGANVNHRGGNHDSALNTAVVEGSWHLVEIMLEYGAEPDCLLFDEIDEEWLVQLREDEGRDAAERYRVLWDRQKEEASNKRERKGGRRIR